MISYQRFIEKWCRVYYVPEPVAFDDLRKAEIKLEFKFPSKYVEAVTSQGVSAVAIHLLNVIVEENLPLNDVSEFFHPSNISDVMNGWRKAGLPEKYIPIAKDCMGNLFCFDRCDGESHRKLDAAIYFFDHDFVEVKDVAVTFTSWIDQLNAITYSED